MAEDDEQTPGGSNATDATDDTNATDDMSGADVPEEQPIEQQLIPFMGDELAAARTDEQYPAVMAYLQDELRRALAGEGPAQASLF